MTNNHSREREREETLSSRPAEAEQLGAINCKFGESGRENQESPAQENSQVTNLCTHSEQKACEKCREASHPDDRSLFLI